MLVFSIKEKWCCVFFQESKSPVDGNHPIRVSTIQVGAAPQAVDPIVTRLFKSYVRSPAMAWGQLRGRSRKNGTWLKDGLHEPGFSDQYISTYIIIYKINK